MYRVCLFQKRNEHGRLVRWAYERGIRDYGGRSAMCDLIPRDDGKTGTITTVQKDNLILECFDG